MKHLFSRSQRNCIAVLLIVVLAGACAKDNDVVQSMVSNSTVRTISTSSVPQELLEQTAQSRDNALRSEFLQIDVKELSSGSNFSFSGASSILPYSFSVVENESITSIDESYDMKTQKTTFGDPEAYQVMKFKAENPGNNAHGEEKYSHGLFLASQAKGTIIGNIQVGSVYTRVIPLNDQGLHLLLQTRTDEVPCEAHETEGVSLPALPESQGSSRAVDNVRLLLVVSENTSYYSTYSSNLTSLGTYTKNFLEDIYDSNVSPNDITFSVVVSSTTDSDFNNSSSSTSLSNFRSDIGTARNNNNADLAAYIAPGNVGWTGRGYIGASTSAWASVNNENQAFSYYTLAHEIGHNFGMRHIRPKDSNSSCGHGYTFIKRSVRTGTSGGSWTSTGKRSVMAYGSTQFSSNRVPEFSDPSRNYNRFIPVRPSGRRDYYRFGMICSSPGGTAEIGGSADNDKRIKDFKGTIAGYK